MVIEQRIRKAFKGFSKSNLDNFNYCSNQKFYVEDIDKAQIVFENINYEKVCLIRNNSLKSICVLSIDKGLFAGDQCDFAAFDDSNKIAFVEMKLNSVTDKLHTQNEHRIKGLRQISNTIRIFKEKGVRLNEFTKEAILCLPEKFPAFDASQLKESIEFVKEFGVEPKQTKEIIF